MTALEKNGRLMYWKSFVLRPNKFLLKTGSFGDLSLNFGTQFKIYGFDFLSFRVW